MVKLLKVCCILSLHLTLSASQDGKKKPVDEATIKGVREFVKDNDKEYAEKAKLAQEVTKNGGYSVVDEKGTQSWCYTDEKGNTKMLAIDPSNLSLHMLIHMALAEKDLNKDKKSEAKENTITNK